jgi:hypothetical protein
MEMKLVGQALETWLRIDVLFDADQAASIVACGNSIQI